MTIWGMLIAMIVVSTATVVAVWLWRRRRTHQLMADHVAITEAMLKFEEMKQTMQTTMHDHFGECSPLDCPDPKIDVRTTTPMWEELMFEMREHERDG